MLPKGLLGRARDRLWPFHRFLESQQRRGLQPDTRDRLYSFTSGFCNGGIKSVSAPHSRRARHGLSRAPKTGGERRLCQSSAHSLPTHTGRGGIRHVRWGGRADGRDPVSSIRSTARELFECVAEYSAHIRSVRGHVVVEIRIGDAGRWCYRGDVADRGGDACGELCGQRDLYGCLRGQIDE